jgi:SAM-dependent methyltransferase
MIKQLRALKRRLKFAATRVTNSNTERFTCPACGYEGPFLDAHDSSGLRKHAECPRCGALERHRLQSLTVRTVFDQRPPSSLSMLHFAPEEFFRKTFSKMFARYETADLMMRGVDHKVDIQKLPFADATYDVVFASHVLEHIPDDRKAISEIRRILRPGGLAFLPVPLLGDKTIEYGAPDPLDFDHVRAPGYDYPMRFSEYFRSVKEYTSDMFPERYQLYLLEDRSQWPNPRVPHRAPSQGLRHKDVVPVCEA